MRDPVQLPPDRGSDLRMPVSVQIGPNGGIGIQEFAAADVSQHGTMTFDDDDGLPFEPIAHLRERMPDVAMIKVSQRMHGGFRIYDLRFTSPASVSASWRRTTASDLWLAV